VNIIFIVKFHIQIINSKDKSLNLVLIYLGYILIGSYYY
jgi:hypothetical protein